MIGQIRRQEPQTWVESVGIAKALAFRRSLVAVTVIIAVIRATIPLKIALLTGTHSDFILSPGARLD